MLSKGLSRLSVNYDTMQNKFIKKINVWPQKLKPEAHFELGRSKWTVLTGSGTSAEFPLCSEH